MQPGRKKKNPLIVARRNQPTGEDSHARLREWTKIVTEEFGFVWSGHYFSTYRDESRLRAALKQIQIKHPHGQITLRSFGEKFGFPEGSLSLIKLKNILPKSVRLSQNLVLFDYKELIDCFKNPKNIPLIIESQSSLKMSTNGKLSPKALKVIDTLQRHGFMAR